MQAFFSLVDMPFSGPVALPGVVDGVRSSCEDEQWLVGLVLVWATELVTGDQQVQLLDRRSMPPFAEREEGDRSWRTSAVHCGRSHSAVLNGSMPARCRATRTTPRVAQ